jgi:hypothetical protein
MAGPMFLTGSGLYSNEAAADAGPISGAPLPLVSGPSFTVDQYQRELLDRQRLAQIARGRTGDQMGIRQRPAYGVPLTNRNPYGTPLSSRYAAMAGLSPPDQSVVGTTMSYPGQSVVGTTMSYQGR